MTRPMVTVDPQVRFGEPAVRGIPVDSIAENVWAGDSVDFVADGYGITRAEVIVACWFHIRHGRFGRGRGDQAWKTAWAPWLRQVESALWHGQYDQVPDPPSKEENHG